MTYHRLFSTAFALSMLLYASAQNRSDSVAVHFRQSRTTLDTSYMQNKEALEHVRVMVERYQHPDSSFKLKEVKVVGGASPEGGVRLNRRLSERRAASIFGYMNRRMELPDSVAERAVLGRDWHGLRAAVAVDENVPYRADVLRVIDEIIESCDNGGHDTDSNLMLLKKVHGGRPYAYMYRHIFPRLREANVVLTFVEPVARRSDYTPLLLDCDSLNYFFAPTLLAFVAPMSVGMPAADRPFYMALKSNMLSDILALPELGVEFYLGKNLSIVGNWMYGWWDKDATHRYWRAYGGDLALRWWFGSVARRKPLTGHHVGLYGGVVTYDFEFGGKGHMGGRPGHNLWDRCMHFAGVEYGYSLPIARRWNIDFTLGLGYMGGKYVEYVPNGECYKWVSTKQKHYVGPTKLEVSLVWLIGHGNYNRKGAAK